MRVAFLCVDMSAWTDGFEWPWWRRDGARVALSVDVLQELNSVWTLRGLGCFSSGVWGC